jgi:hypothetical protein
LVGRAYVVFGVHALNAKAPLFFFTEALQTFAAARPSIDRRVAVP